MVKDAEANAEEDKKTRSLIEARNEADTLIYSIEKMMKENEAKVQEDEKNQIYSAISNLRSAMEGNSLEALTKAKTDLEQASHGFAQRIYQDAASQQQGSEGGEESQETSEAGGADTSHENVYDADYEVIDDDEKK